MNTDQTTEPILRSEKEKRADAICLALNELEDFDENSNQLVWQYFRNGHDALGFQLMQLQILNRIADSLEKLEDALDKNGNLSVINYPQSE